MSTLDGPQFRDLYHYTSPEAAAQIAKFGFNKGHHNRAETYFTTKADSEYASAFGTARVHVRGVPEHLLNIDDAFPDGEEHYWTHHRNIRPEHIIGVTQP
jgi:hypothetical protein